MHCSRSRREIRTSDYSIDTINRCIFAFVPIIRIRKVPIFGYDVRNTEKLNANISSKARSEWKKIPNVAPRILARSMRFHVTERPGERGTQRYLIEIRDPRVLWAEGVLSSDEKRRAIAIVTSPARVSANPSDWPQDCSEVRREGSVESSGTSWSSKHFVTTWT